MERERRSVQRVPGVELRELREGELRNILGDDVEVIDLSAGRNEVKPATWHVNGG